MSATPLVSVVMLSYNHSRFLNESIESVLSQTESSSEFIIVDNASSDDSRTIIERWRRLDSRILPVFSERHVNIAAALNLGVKAAKGEYIARIDSDDAWCRPRLERQLEIMSQSGNSDIGVCGAWCLLVNPAGTVVGTKEFPLGHEECVRAFWYRNPFCHTATLIRRRCFEEFGGYNESYNFAEDLELWFRFGRAFRLVNVPEHLIRYRVLAGNVTLRKHRAVIRATLRARLLARREYHYPMDALAQASYLSTWCMQWLPGFWVNRIFYDFLLKRCSRLWRSPSGGRTSPGDFPEGAGDSCGLVATQPQKDQVCKSSISPSRYTTNRAN